MYVVFTRMAGESYRRSLRSVLLCFCMCDVCRVLINKQRELTGAHKTLHDPNRNTVTLVSK